MQTVRMKRVTIIADDTVKYRIIKEIQEIGATSYTDCLAHGKGAKGERPRHAEPANAKIEIIATPEVAQRIPEQNGAAYAHHGHGPACSRSILICVSNKTD